MPLINRLGLILMALDPFTLAMAWLVVFEVVLSLATNAARQAVADNIGAYAATVDG